MQVVVDAGEAARGDADHREVHAADADGRSDDARVRAEAPYPLVVVEHYYGDGASRLVFVGLEGASVHRAYAHGVEEVAADGHPDLALRGLFAGHGEARRHDRVGHDAV